MPKKKGIHFEVSERKILLRIMDALFVLGFLYVIGASFHFDYFTVTKEEWMWSLVLAVYITFFGTVFELYDLKASSKLDTTFRNIVLTVSLTVLLYLLTPVITPFLPVKRLQIVYFYIAIIAALFLWRWLYASFITSPRFNKRVIIIGEVSNLETILKTFGTSDPSYKIVGFVNSEGQSEDRVTYKGLTEYLPYELPDVIVEEYISEVVVAIYDSENITSDIYSQLTMLLEKGFTIREYTQVYEEITKRVPVQYVGKDFYKYFPFSRSNQNQLYMFYHRLLDVCLALIGMTLGLCLLPLILMGNLIANRGPLFYKQERVGKRGATFDIVKFRTMIKNAETEGAQWADKNDDRVTGFGRFLRNSRIDEIPQFYNILKGEMSVIGPRPERSYFVKELSQIIPFYETRHTIKPGLSGWAQVNSRYGSSVEDSLEKLQYDLYYIKHRSLFLDINILVKTLATVLYYRGQ
jgi:exopolysaccharide biosynthesis polyprenyl glycosylphosphotransferase